MKVLKSIKNIFSFSLLGVVAFSCSDDMKVEVPSTVSTGSISLLIPNIDPNNFEGTRADSPVVGNEGSLNDLWLYVFKLNSDNSTYSPVEEYVGVDIKNSISNKISTYQSYEMDLEEGTYQIYLLANVSSYAGATDLSEISKISGDNSIESLNLTFTDVLAENNLPMACFSAIKEDENGTATSGSSVTISPSDKEDGKSIYCDLSFLCSKVRYTILFDNTQESTGVTAGVSKAFRDHVVDFDGTVIVSSVAQTTNVKTPLANSEDKWTGNYITGQKSGNLYKYTYPVDIYPDPTKNNIEEINKKTAWTSNEAHKRAWQGVVYLPENTYTNNKTTLTFSGNCYTGPTSTEEIYSISKSVELIPSHNNCENNDGTNHGILRGKMYDLAFSIENYDAIDVTIGEAVWTPMAINLDFVSTFLTLEKTEGINVTSNEPEELIYDTDGRTGVTLTCSKKQTITRIENGETITEYLDYIVAEPRTRRGVKYLQIKPNNALDLNALSEDELTGTDISCYVHSGNITKEIKVTYDIEPFFEITPRSLSFNWNDKVSSSGSFSLPAQLFEYETNLGGIYLYEADENKNYNINSPLNDSNLANGITFSETVKKGDDSNTAQIKIQLSNPKNYKGNITVSSLNDPQYAVAHYYFMAKPREEYSGTKTYNKEIFLMISVIPENSDYRIYFRAINDYTIYNGSNNSWGEFLDGGNYNNWVNESSSGWINDWWKNNGGVTDRYDTNFYGWAHRTYIYSQDGETKNEGEGKAWVFTSPSNYVLSPSMTQSDDYAGWCYYDLSATNSVTAHGSTRVPEPGKTFMIFFSLHKDGNELHRAPHNNDAGIALFDYEDREGFVLYDPTMEPYYRIYDEYPIVEDIEYVVYTPKALTEWIKYYGNSDPTGKTIYQHPAKYSIYYNYSNTTHDSSRDNVQVTGNGTTWYKSKIKLKAPQGDYIKDISLYYKDSNGDQYVYIDIQLDWNPFTPLIQFYNGNTNLTEQMPMESCASPFGINPGDRWYRYKVPSNASNSYVRILQRENTDNVWTFGQSLNNIKSTVYYIQFNNNNRETYRDTYNESLIETTLMGGENYQVETNGGINYIFGYFDGSQWRRGTPPGVSKSY